MTFLQELKNRGLVFQTTNEEALNKELEENERMIVYAGFDPTAESLQIGNLLTLVTLARFKKAGYTPIFLLGSATGMIGDPSGKAEERTLLSPEQLDKNISAVREDITNFIQTALTNTGIDTKDISILENLDWISKLNTVEYLRDTGKYFSVNAMINRDSVKTRLQEREQGISYTEFSYMLLQAYDYWFLNKYSRCTLQIGGSDQWGNIVSGIDLISKRENKKVHGLTWPLLLDAQGNKFGKTAKGAIFLSPNKTSPYDFYQFWFNVPDTEVVKYLKLFTFLSVEEIDRHVKFAEEKENPRHLQILLTQEMMIMVHGFSEYKKAKTISKILFNTELDSIKEDEFVSALAHFPLFKTLKDSSLREDKNSLVDLLNDCSTLSKREIKQLITNGAILINGKKITSIDTKISEITLLFDKYYLTQIGKKKFIIIELYENV